MQRLRGRVALPGMGCGRGVTAAPVGAWRRRAAHQAAASPRHRRRPLPVPQGQRDARWPGSARQHAGETDAAGAGGPDGAEGRHGGGRSVAPAWRWRRAAVVGPRPRATAQAVVAAPTARGRGSPACGSAGCPGALAARLPACHVMTPWARPGPRGRPRPPRGAPPPDLVSAPGVTQTTQGTLLTLRPRVVRGAARLPQRGRTRRPAWVARGPLPVRQAWAPWARTTARGWQDRERLRQRVGGFQAGSQVARPPRRVRQPWPRHERPRRGALRPRWRARTPALAAGVTEPVWTLRALLTATCEPLDSQSSSG